LTPDPYPINFLNNSIQSWAVAGC